MDLGLQGSARTGDRHMSDGFVHLRAGGVSLLLDARGPGLPTVLHWGADLGADVDAAAVALASVTRRRALRPGRADGAVRAAPARGRPPWPPGPVGQPAGPGLLAVVPADGRGRRGRHRDAARRGRGRRTRGRGPGTARGSGLLRMRSRLRNAGADGVRPGELAVVLPRARPGGGAARPRRPWLRERRPQRHPFAARHLAAREPARPDRPRRDPVLARGHGRLRLPVAARCGRVHLAWSGDSRALRRARRRAACRCSAAGELLAPGEVRAGAGRGVRDTRGLSRLLRRRAGRHRGGRSTAGCASRPQHPRTPRPVVLNTWEAVYFDHDLAGCAALADAAAASGSSGSCSTTAGSAAGATTPPGLGDWYVDEELAATASTRSSTTCAGSAWSSASGSSPRWSTPTPTSPARTRTGCCGRRAGCRRRGATSRCSTSRTRTRSTYLLERLDALLTEHDIDYLKWDHNRDLLEAGRRPAGRRCTRRRSRRTGCSTSCARRHPALEIESARPAARRIDLGILERTDRVWATDTQRRARAAAIQRWTGLLLPPELSARTSAPPRAHTTGRAHGLSFRAATALFGHFGIEWDLSARAAAGASTSWPPGSRCTSGCGALLHSGTVVHADPPDPSAVAARRRRPGRRGGGLRVRAADDVRPGGAGPVALPGLDPERVYRVRPVEGTGARGVARALPAWWGDGEVHLTGRVLGEVGIRLPVLDPAEALLLELTARR